MGYLLYIILCAVGQVDLSEVVGINTTCIDGGWKKIYQQTTPIIWNSTAVQDCVVNSCSFWQFSDYLALDNLQDYEDDGYAFLILWDNTYWIQWKQALNPLTIGADSATDPLSGDHVSLGISENLHEDGDLDFSGLSLSPDDGVLLDGRSTDGAWFAIAVTVDIQLTKGDTSVGIPAWKFSGSDSSHFSQQVNLYVWNSSCGEWGIPSLSPTETPTSLPSQGPKHEQMEFIFNGNTGSNDNSVMQVLLGLVIGGFMIIICFLLICWRHMEKVRRKEMKRAVEKVNQKLAEELFSDMNGWRLVNLNCNPYQNPQGWNVEVQSQMPGSYNVPLKMVQSPYVMNEYTNHRSTYNPEIPYNAAVHYNQTLPYTSQAAYKRNMVPIINPDLSAESKIISNLWLRMNQNMENSVSFPLQSATAPQSTSYSKIGSPRRKEFLPDSYSKVSGYQPGIAKLSISGDMVERQRFASEEEESSSDNETIRDSNRIKVKLKNRRQLEESDSSSSSFSESSEHSSDSSLVIHKPQTMRRNIDLQNEKLDLGEFEGMCERLGILQAEDMCIEGASNRQI